MSRLPPSWVLLAFVGASAGVSGCNALTGVSDLEAVDCLTDCVDGGGDGAVAVDATPDTRSDTADAAAEAATDAADGEVADDAADAGAGSCTDKAQNGTESDVDCGGSCPGCAVGKKCGVAADCLSKVCTAKACVAARCDDGVQNGEETAIDCGGSACAPCGTLLFTAPGTDASITTPKVMGTLKAYAGKRIRIVKVGICGDSDATSGPNRFVATDGAAMSFSWAAGQTTVAIPGTTTYRLAPTPPASGSARGFSYQVVSHLGAVGQPMTVSWDFHADYDGLLCGALDEDGASYSDPASSVRVWLKYRYE
ncbi:MAG: hypothetical protein IPJ34_06200 [Myxococcales bacterium]|nr:hypothetical protein [Myxococcales bacterium]